ALFRSRGSDAEAGVVHEQVDASVQTYDFPDGGFDGVVAGHVEREHRERSLARLGSTPAGAVNLVADVGEARRSRFTDTRRGSRDERYLGLHESPPLKARFAPFDEGLNAFLEVLGGEDGLLDGRNGFDCRPLALLEVLERRLLRRAQPEGGALADPSRDLHRALAVLPVRMDLLHEANAQRLLRVELVAEEQMVHRVAPARTGQVAEVRTAERRDPALRLELTEPRGVGRDDNVARQHDLDTDGVGD